MYWQRKKLQRGTSADFGVKSKILCNPNVILDIWKCNSVRNAFKSKFGSSVLIGEVPKLEGEQGLNTLLMGMGLPPLVEYRKGTYLTMEEAITADPDDFTYALADKSLAWIGVRPKGQQNGAMKLTRNAGLVKPAVHYDTVNFENEQKAEIAQGIYVRCHYIDRIPHHYDIEMSVNAAPILFYRRSTAGITYS